ncbi:MAG: MYXO-CTERM sorting domain-containing protein [Kofleriaceae bacterium]
MLRDCWIFMLFVLTALTGSATAGGDAEVERLRQHFTIVDHELRAADVSGLTNEQRVRRAALIAELARYRERGMFPRNLDFAAQTPYFIDDRGVRCAMAHLVETHGGAALVARVAASSNNAYVRELAVDVELGPALGAWLERVGLTAAEAARIQPSYVREVGERCSREGGIYPCMQGITCTPALDDAEMAYCSPACDPAASECPVGLAGIQMECQSRGDEYVCVYAGKSPGSLGWECDADTAGICAWACAGLDEPGDIGSCAPSCSDSQACPVGYECEPHRDESGADELRTCVPQTEDGGCSAAESGSAYMVGLLALTLFVRRRRGSATGR